MLTVSEPNSINMLWIVPQFVVMTLGEVKLFLHLQIHLIIHHYYLIPHRLGHVLGHWSGVLLLAGAGEYEVGHPVRVAIDCRCWKLDCRDNHGSQVLRVSGK